MGFFSLKNFFFRTARELVFYNFFSRAKREFFFRNLTLRLYDKNSESDFFPPPKSEYFFSNIGNQNIFLEKKNIPPPPLSS